MTPCDRFQSPYAVRPSSQPGERQARAGGRTHKLRRTDAGCGARRRTGTRSVARGLRAGHGRHRGDDRLCRKPCGAGRRRAVDRLDPAGFPRCRDGAASCAGPGGTGAGSVAVPGGAGLRCGPGAEGGSGGGALRISRRRADRSLGRGPHHRSHRHPPIAPGGRGLGRHDADASGRRGSVPERRQDAVAGPRPSLAGSGGQCPWRPCLRGDLAAPSRRRRGTGMACGVGP